MVVIEDKIQNIDIKEDLCIALGTFDGVHIGHQKLIKEAVVLSKTKGMKSAVLTFNNHPLNIIKPEYNIKLITDNNTKIKIFQSLGVDYVFFLEFDKEFANIEPLSFIDYLCNRFKAKTIICGYNFTFGKYGIGDTDFLNNYKTLYGYDLIVINKVTHNGTNISSSIIRQKIQEGKIEEANTMLGYNLFYYGEVVKGKHIGNKLGFPTANIKIPLNLCLRNGVYITKTYIDDKYYPSISNIGFTPTLKSNDRMLETHIFDLKDNLYNSHIKVEFLSYLRDEIKFNDVSQLKDRVYKDISIAKEYFQLK